MGMASSCQRMGWGKPGIGVEGFNNPGSGTADSAGGEIVRRTLPRPPGKTGCVCGILKPQAGAAAGAAGFSFESSFFGSGARSSEFRGSLGAPDGAGAAFFALRSCFFVLR